MQISLAVASRSNRSLPSMDVLAISHARPAIVHNQRDVSAHDRESIPVEIIESLPPILRDGAKLLDTDHERGVFITCALGVLSGSLPNVLGRHADGAMPLNIFTAIEAPAGSGKGALRYARKLGQSIDLRLRAQALTEQGDWAMQNGKPSWGSSDSRPPMRSLFLSGNSSERGLLEALFNSKGTGVVLESEAVTLAKLFGGVGGNSLDLLLKGFHNEPVSITRKGDHLHIPSPRFSVVVTGTPDTLKSIISGTESGLLSRFAIYSFQAPAEWKSHRPNEHTHDRDLFFEKAADRIDTLYEMLDKRAVQGVQPLVVELKAKHWDKLDRAFETELMNLQNPVLEASVKRAAIVAFRIACILSVLRAFEKKRKLNQIDVLTATDSDASTGLALALLYLRHSVRVAARFPQSSYRSKDQRRADFYSSLPTEFTTAEAVQIGESLHPSVPLRSVMRYLDGFLVDGLLQRKKHGLYSKPE